MKKNNRVTTGMSRRAVYEIMRLKDKDFFESTTFVDPHVELKLLINSLNHSEKGGDKYRV